MKSKPASKCISKPKSRSVAWYKKKLWRIFSLYIRTRDSGRCFTCGIQSEIKFMQAGHFYQRAICPPPLYFHESNVRCQCFRCNIWLRGNVAVYAERIRQVDGEKTLDELHNLLGKPVQWKKEDYEKLIETYQKKLKELSC